VRKSLTTACLTAVGIMSFAGVAAAGPNDITLQRFVGLEQSTDAGGRVILSAVPDEEGFRDFARDLGLIFTPKLATSPETLGQAGFAFQIDQSVSLIDNNSDYWRAGSVSGEPSGSIQSTAFRFRKGLPFSFELGGAYTAMWKSELMAVGTELRWAPTEDMLWPVPDLAFRGYVNSVLGDQQLNLTTAGFDVVVGVPIGVGNVMNISPYAGYNAAVVISSSRLIDATPEDLTPPYELTPNPSTPPGTIISNQPEAVFDVDSELVHQGMFGVRFEFAMVNANFQGLFSGSVQSYTFSLGANF
jgi:hypothetical protein